MTDRTAAKATRTARARGLSFLRALGILCVIGDLSVEHRAFAQAADYEQLVDSYARGSFARPIVALAAWPEARVRLAVQNAHLDPAQIKAAAMLHTETAIAISNQRLAYLHIDRARILLGGASSDDRMAFGLTAFTARWTVLDALVYTAYGDLRRARIEIDRALRENIDNKDVLLVDGALNEIDLRRVEPNPRGRWNNTTAGDQSRAKAALDVYVPLVARHPDFLEGRLRLGWALLLNHSSAPRIREQLDAVVEQARRRDLQYLAHLFLGALDERETRLADAGLEYEKAHTALPRQASYVALIHVDRALGLNDRAQSLANQVARATVAGEDPWQTFNAGLTGGELVDWLRREAATR